MKTEFGLVCLLAGFFCSVSLVHCEPKTTKAQSAVGCVNGLTTPTGHFVAIASPTPNIMCAIKDEGSSYGHGSIMCWELRSCP